MKGLAFFDTNIFLYADDAASPEKQAQAIYLITKYQRVGLVVISLQVLQEYFSAATRKLGVEPELAQRKGGIDIPVSHGSLFGRRRDRRHRNASAAPDFVLGRDDSTCGTGFWRGNSV